MGSHWPTCELELEPILPPHLQHCQHCCQLALPPLLLLLVALCLLRELQEGAPDLCHLSTQSLALPPACLDLSLQLLGSCPQLLRT